MISRHRFTLPSFAVLTGILALAPLTASPQVPVTMPAPHTETAPIAQKALQVALKVSGKAITLSTLGLRSREEAGRATLGAGITIREIGYDRLLAWQPGADPATVFVGPPQVLYPLMVGTEARSALTLVRKPSGWELSSYGDAERVSSVFRARETLRKEAGGAGEHTSLVVVPAFRLEFVAESRGTRTLLRPVVPEPAAEAGIDGTLEAARAIEILATHAREYDRQYGEEIRRQRLVH